MPGPYPAELYAATHTGTPGDLAFYQNVCKGGQHVLELGCGAGRVLAALAESPCTLVGIDNDLGLLELARERLGQCSSIELKLGDIRRFALERTFDRILLPHSGLYCLLDDSEVLDCLRCVIRHLSPTGVFVMDGYVADEFHAVARPDDLDDEELVPVTEIEARGQRWNVFERSHWDPLRQRITAEYVYVPQDHPLVQTGIIEQRYLMRPQVLDLLREANFASVEMFGGFDGLPCNDQDEIWVAIAHNIRS